VLKSTLLFTLLLIAMSTGCYAAASQDEEYYALMQFKLPKPAVLLSNLTERDSVLYREDKLFTGTAFSRYANGDLQQVTQYKNGRKNGLMYVWYPDGKPQLMSYNTNGQLNGRFKGWYQFGGVIYDLVISKGKYGGDQLIETDSSRETSEESDSEQTGDAGEGKGD